MRDEGRNNEAKGIRKKKTSHKSRVTSHAYEVSLQNALRGDGINAGLEPRAARAGRAQQPLRLVRGQALVHQFRAHSESPVQPVGEATGEPADGMLGAIGVRGQPDYQQCRAPFRDEPLDGREPRAVVRCGNAGQGVRHPGLEIADRDADALRAEVKGEDGPRPRVRGEG